MTLTKEDFDHVNPGDWLHVAFSNGSQASGVVSAGSEGAKWIIFSPTSPNWTYLVDSFGVYPSSIIEHRPMKRAPKVGDVIEEGEWDRYDWPAGLTRLSTYIGAEGNVYSVDGKAPRYRSSGEYVASGHVLTVVQLPAVSRILYTAEEVEALPVGAVVMDRVDWVYRRKEATPLGWSLSPTGAVCQGTSDMDFPVTLLRLGAS